MSDIIVYGRGKTGQSLLKMLQKLHFQAVLYDDAMGFDGNGKFTKDSLVLVSPGVPPTAKGIVLAKSVGATVVGELEFCFPHCKGKCISVTGTNGKTTTCEMIFHVLRQVGIKSRLLGNGGVPLSSQVLEVGSDETVVLESSSFQLLNCQSFAPYVSVFTNLAVDHLNYHRDFAEYSEAKQNNFVHQRQGFAIFNADDANVLELSKQCRCTKLFYSLSDAKANCYYDGNNVIVQIDGAKSVVSCKYFAELARHNQSNALAAVLACYAVGVSADQAAKAIESYNILPHRLQKVATIDGVTFVDDSKATNVHATVSALNCFSQNLALILGGSNKGERFDDIFVKLQANVKVVVAVGQTANAICQCAKGYGVDVVILDDIKQATCYCFERLKDIGGVVLMSNACASFDSFSGYEERGKYFQKVVTEIQSGKKTY